VLAVDYFSRDGNCIGGNEASEIIKNRSMNEKKSKLDSSSRISALELEQEEAAFEVERLSQMLDTANERLMLVKQHLHIARKGAGWNESSFRSAAMLAAVMPTCHKNMTTTELINSARSFHFSLKQANFPDEKIRFFLRMYLENRTGNYTLIGDIINDIMLTSAEEGGAA
jgi:hypothetical protein